jgi:N6-adenosine-specific RNA methylase IME4
MTAAEIDAALGDPHRDNSRGHGPLVPGKHQTGSSRLAEPLLCAGEIEHWIACITTSWRRSTEAIIETGRLLADAKATLPHGAFGRMIASELPFDARTAQMLMAIAADPRLQNPHHGSLLPPSWRTLYELTRLDDATLDARIADGTIRPNMERRDIALAVKRARRAARERELGKKQLAAPEAKYGVIVEDFEWDHETRSDRGRDRAAENHYPVSRDAHTAQEIVERTKDRFACAAADCVCFMWTPLQHVAIAIDVMRLRGFEYRSQYAWGKDKIGLGYWSREKHEILLIGVKGDIACPAPGTQWDSLILAPRGAHSAKPECFLEMIEHYFPTLPKIELNRRGPPRTGWNAWGNEAEQRTDVMGALAPGSILASLGTSPPPDDGLEIPNFLRIGHPDCWRSNSGLMR